MVIEKRDKNRKLFRDKHVEVVTVLRDDTVLRGEIEVKTSLRIEGSYEGKIICHGYLHLDKNSVVKADVEADVILVEGTVHGNIHAHHRAELAATAEVYGDVTTHKLVISDGVVFSGNCKMIREDGSYMNE